MRNYPRPFRQDGVALIIVLGMLTIISLLVVSFMRSMRDERQTTKDHVDLVRARQLVPVAIVRAMEDVDRRMASSCYPPFWTNAYQDVACSTGAALCPDILDDQAVAAIPAALRTDASNAAAGSCYWTPVITDDGRTNGRVAYLVVNCSGLLDANVVGGTTRTGSTSVSELDLSGLPEMADSSRATLFCSNRILHRRYETIAELAKLNPGVLADPVSNLFVYSYDPGRDMYFTNQSELGLRTIGLTNKFRINRLATYTNYTTEPFVSEYWRPLVDLLARAGLRTNTDSIAWNIVDYLDPDRIPSAAGGEAVPRLNEIVLTEDPPGSTNYQLVVELWFPFAPVCLTSGDSVALRTEICHSDPLVTATSVYAVGNMEFGNVSNEFLTFTSSSFRITTDVTNIVAISVGHPVTVSAQVLVGAAPMPGAVYGPTGLTSTIDLSVNDPRGMEWEPMMTNTLGTMNANCAPWADGGQGLPIFHRDGPMQSIGELGHIYCSDPDRPWRNIDLMSTDEGAALLDWMTARATNAGAHGLVSISTAQKDVLRVLFHNMMIGYTNRFFAERVLLPDANIGALVDAIVANGPYLGFRDLFHDGTVAKAFSDCVPSNSAPAVKGELSEDILRNIAEMITFRQNLFTIIVAAQVLAPDGIASIAEKRAVAIVYRDAYTGKHFTRSFRWLTD